MMQRYGFALLFLLPVGQLARAESTMDALKALGAKVTLDKQGEITQLSFTDSSKLGAKEFELIGSCTHLKNLTLYGKCSGLTDETLPLLKGLEKLETLSTDLIMVSDEGFRGFAPMKSLKSLALFHCGYQFKPFTGKGFVHLKALPNLQQLTYGGTTTGTDALKALATISQLTDLRTWHNWNTIEDAAVIGGMTQLKHLRYGQRLRRYTPNEPAPSLSDTTLTEFAKLKQLETLHLDEARLTFAGLKALKTLPELKKLTLERIDIPAADVERLKAELPGVAITWMPMTAEEAKRLDAILADRRPAPNKQ